MYVFPLGELGRAPAPGAWPGEAAAGLQLGTPTTAPRAHAIYIYIYICTYIYI